MMFEPLVPAGDRGVLLERARLLHQHDRCLLAVKECCRRSVLLRKRGKGKVLRKLSRFLERLRRKHALHCRQAQEVEDEQTCKCVGQE
jgi:hypothetical protein